MTIVAAPDNAGVRTPPPFLFAGTAALSVLLHFTVHDPSLGLGIAFRYALAAILVAAAILLAAGALRLFARIGTNVEPWKPSTALVMTGVFRWTRNPMYVSMAILLLALAVATDSVIGLALLVPFLLAIRYFVIAREERYLEAKFPDEYQHYKRQVRRWL
ncbi:MAG: methyltransferase family protein [Sphingomonas sp.]